MKSPLATCASSSVSAADTGHNVWRKIKRFGVVEPFFFLVTFSMFARRVVSSELMLAKACTLVLNHTRNECVHITDADMRVQVLQVGNNYNLAAILVITGPSLLTGMLLGAFSDVYGRKWPMLLAPAGTLFSVAGYALSVAYWEVPIIWLVLVHLPSGVLGGTTMVTSGVYSYVSKVSRVEDRALRFSVLEVVNILGMTVGTAVGGALFRYAGYFPVYALCGLTLAASIVWLAVALEEESESTVSKRDPEPGCTSLGRLFSFATMREVVQTCTKKRDHNGRLYLWLLVVSGCFVKLAVVGPGSIGYYYVKEVFHWGVDHYSYVSTASKVSHAVAVALIVPLLARRVSDPLLGIVGVLSIVTEAVGKGLAHQEWMFYLALGLGTLSGTASVAVKNQISKLVPKDELSKVFMLISLTESLCTMGGTTLFSQLYNIFLTTLPGAPYLAAAASLFFPAMVLVWLLPARNASGGMQVGSEHGEELTLGIYRTRSWSVPYTVNEFA